MNRTITMVLAFLITTSSMVHADDGETSLLKLEFEHQYLHRTDMNMSHQEYEKIYSHNQGLVLNNLKSYSENALELIGIPGQGINLMGAALGFAFGESRLNLNRSKTLSLEIRDVRDSNRTLYFGVKLDW